MLSYRHGFHAGNFADVFKHLVLTLLLEHLRRKDKPFRYLDTHAGAGLYDLQGEMARKNREHEGGIARLWRAPDPPEEVRGYLGVVRACNADGRLRHYPGSPRLARHFLRPRDRMTLCDLHSTEARTLQSEFAGDRQVTVQHIDGYQALKALLPPGERRGLVLIDPAYESKDERARLLTALQEAGKRWPTGIYAIWYPIQERATVDWFHRRLKHTGFTNILLAELRIYDQDQALRLNGSGMIVINPPWKLDAALEQLGPWLWQTLSPTGEGGFRLEWLSTESA
jgi:23S rRNA (adenine2030-N6)-methyltransferase